MPRHDEDSDDEDDSDSWEAKGLTKEGYRDDNDRDATDPGQYGHSITRGYAAAPGSSPPRTWRRDEGLDDDGEKRDGLGGEEAEREYEEMRRRFAEQRRRSGSPRFPQNEYPATQILTVSAAALPQYKRNLVRSRMKYISPD
ncbi:hypothetical protein B0I37DRAFT_412085 [Chaetomium sp. MPI-CAGE-AT-0009]|nr:hypothetical protein B0I37DRAFT_412085 [Chaetomium sp. MPI-CAGE-AT-0009]